MGPALLFSTPNPHLQKLNLERTESSPDNLEFPPTPISYLPPSCHTADAEISTGHLKEVYPLGPSRSLTCPLNVSILVIIPARGGPSSRVVVVCNGDVNAGQDERDADDIANNVSLCLSFKGRRYDDIHFLKASPAVGVMMGQLPAVRVRERGRLRERQTEREREGGGRWY